MREQNWDRAVISGLGKSAVGRRLGRTGLSLTIEAVRAAVADAGLTLGDIDGVSTFPGGRGPTAGGTEISELQDALKLDLRWYNATGESPAQLSALVNAFMAVSCGLARHVVVYKTLTESSNQGSGGRKGIDNLRLIPGMQWTVDWMASAGSLGIANWYAPYAQRYFHDYGASREMLGWVPLTIRRHAQLNPVAIYRDSLTMEDYLGARMVSDPLCLYDCDVPADMCTVLIVSRADTVPDLASRPVRLESVGTAAFDRPTWDQFASVTHNARGAAAQMWAETELSVDDVDVVQFYDGFSIFVLLALEATGICGEGEAAEFVTGGHRISLDGELPLNTDGGQLSAGRSHGFGLLYESCRQLRGDACERQAPDAEVALAGSAAGPSAGFLLFTGG